jgi:hypothetical protein
MQKIDRVVPFGDSKLKSKIGKANFKEAKVSAVISGLSRYSGLKFTCEHNQIRDVKISVLASDFFIMDIMDALVSVGDYAWNKVADNTYLLAVGFWVLDSLRDPKGDSYTKSIYDLGKTCLDFINNPENRELKRKFSKGLTFSDFSPELQEEISRFAKTTGGLSNFSADSVKVNIIDATRAVGDGNSLGEPRVSINFQYKNDQGETSTSYFAVDFAETRKKLSDNAKNNIRYNYTSGVIENNNFEKMEKSGKIPDEWKKVRVDFNETKTFPEFLWAVAEKHNINIVCDGESKFKYARKINVENMPFVEFLEMLLVYFPGSEIDIRPSGFIVARGPLNAWVVRKKKANNEKKMPSGSKK